MSLSESTNRISSKLPLTAIETRWEHSPCDSVAAARISQDLGLHPVVARILASRGFSAAQSEAMNEFLKPLLKSIRSPFVLSDMDAAVERTLSAIRNGEKICVYGDYDVDGVTSTTLMAKALQLLGTSPQIVIPHRIRDGYGMNEKRVEEIARSGVKLILTVDTGVTALGPVQLARELGVDVVVTDHHLAGEELPAAVAVVNPNLAHAMYEGGKLCGVGVVFKFVHALLKKSGLGEADSRSFLYSSLDLVALGTIADVVPLLGENRVLVRHGLKVLEETKRPGLRALMEVSGCLGKSMDAMRIGFVLGPRLNAAGRTQDARTALKLLMTDDYDEALSLARELEEMNQQRRAIEKDILEDSLRLAESHLGEGANSALVVGGEGWHVGVVGIVAARLVDRFHLPAIVLAIEAEQASGSARSIPGFDIHDALSACGRHLDSFGGHAAAAGLRLQSGRVTEFREALNSHAAEQLDRLGRFRRVPVDVEVTGQEIDWDLLRDLDRLEPYGEANPEPVMQLSGARVMYTPRVVGRNHLKVKLNAGGRTFDGIGWSLGDLVPMLEENRQVDVLFRPKKNDFNGSVSIQLQLVDVRASETGG